MCDDSDYNENDNTSATLCTRTSAKMPDCVQGILYTVCLILQQMRAITFIIPILQ